MAANTSTSFARSASTLAGPVFSTTTYRRDGETMPVSPKTKLPTPHRPNKAELEALLFHAQVRAQVRRLRQSVTGQDLPSANKPTRAVASSIPRNFPTITTTSGFAILAPTAIRPSPLSIPNAPKLGPLPTPPETPEPLPETRPLLPTRRSRAAPLPRPSGSRLLNLIGEDPILTPNHVFPDNMRRTPGATATQLGENGASSGVSYFHLPPGLLEIPAAEQPTAIATSTSTSTPRPTAAVGLGITVPTDVRRRTTTTKPVVGLGITGVDCGEEGRIERCILTIY
ncbi:hypothetical protein LXA43DRAFT_398714 [Ganoderma leucocontextum]|nr:hypothetical protein LXA43DRAFT_398714 [Ganoderma leucocontextum]